MDNDFASLRVAQCFGIHFGKWRVKGTGKLAGGRAVRNKSGFTRRREEREEGFFSRLRVKNRA